MWFVGLILGGLIGAVGGFGTALLGAILGTIVGAVLGASGKSNSDGAQSGHESAGGPARDVATRLADIERQVNHVFKSLEDIHWRLAALEKPGEQREPRPDMSGSAAVPVVQSAAESSAINAVAPPGAEVSPMPAVNSQRSELTVEQAVAMEGLDAVPLKDAPLSQKTSPQADSNTVLEKPIAGPEERVSQDSDRKWLIGLCVGGVLGMMGGFGTAVLGAVFGAVAGMLVSTILEFRRPRGTPVSERPDAASEEVAESMAADSTMEPPRAPDAAIVPAESASVQEIPRAPIAAGGPEAAAPAPGGPVARGVAPFDVDEAPPELPHAASGPKWWQRWLEGNIVAKVGAVILFFGVGFLLKFAYDHTVLPVPVRLLGVALCGCGMVYGGWWLRGRRRLYGLILQGAGIGVLYVDVFFALKVFALIHPVVGFALFMALGIAATLLAVRQDAKVLAVLGLTGAFLAPVLAGSGTGRHVLLFSYYTLLNSFILAISWFKSWRDLNLTGFIFTFIVGVAWGANNYRPEIFGSVEPFVLIFFAMYLVIPILFAARQPPQLKGLVDATLVFGTPLSVAFMQASLVRDMPYGLAWSAGCGAGLYAVLAFFVVRREGMRLLGETYIALSVVLATLAIFFALDAYPTFALWSLEGAAIVWVGLRQQRVLARAFGLFVQLAGAGYFALHYNDYTFANPWFNDFTLGCALIFFASTLTAWLMNKLLSRGAVLELAVSCGVLMWGCAWWLAGGLHALHYGVTADYFPSAALTLFGVSALVAEWAGARLGWVDLRKMTRAHLLLMALVGAHWFMRALSVETVATHPLAQAGYAAWPFNFAVLFWCLHCQMRDALTTTASPRYYGGWILMGLLATWMAVWLQMHDEYGWAMTWGALGIGAGWIRYRLREYEKSDAWPVSVAALGWGLAFWLVPGLSYIHENIAHSLHVAGGLGFATASVVVFEIVGAWLKWAALRRAQIILPFVMLYAAAYQFLLHSHPLADYGWVVWPTGFATLYIVLIRHERSAIAIGASVQRLSMAALLAALLTWEASWLLVHHHFELAAVLGFVAIGGSYLRFHLRERNDPQASQISPAALAWGLIVWLLAGLGYVDENVAADSHIACGLGWVVATCALAEPAGSGLKWNALRSAANLLLPTMVIAVLMQIDRQLHPAAGYAGIAWLAAFTTLFAALYRQQKDGISVKANIQHLFAIWIATGLGAWECAWQWDAFMPATSGPFAMWGLVPAIVMIALARYGRLTSLWQQEFGFFRNAALGPLALYGVAWSLLSNVNPGDSAPLAYFPLLNPVDLAQAATLFGLYTWLRAADAATAGRERNYPVVLSALGFVWVNAIVLRSIHHWSGVPYFAHDLFNSIVVQAAFSLLWTFTAMALMVVATRRLHRKPWFAGAALLAVVVGKLFLLDLANSGTVERIVSFLGVGVLLMVIGYVAPVPPGDVEKQQ